MTLPVPEPGLVIPYAYLWRREHRKGQDEGSKVRPAVIVLAVQQVDGGAPQVTVAAITHSPPMAGSETFELPPRVKQWLGLDTERSWIALDEVNQFSWPGFDLRPVPGTESFAYGHIPPKLYDAIISRLLELAATRRVFEISRD